MHDYRLCIEWEYLKVSIGQYPPRQSLRWLGEGPTISGGPSSVPPSKAEPHGVLALSRGFSPCARTMNLTSSRSCNIKTASARPGQRSTPMVMRRFDPARPNT